MSSSNNGPSVSDPAPSVSVVIPTYHDWDRLAECLKALDVQTYPSHLIEVLVVNNDPADQAPSGFTDVGEIRLLNEAAPGSYAARNRGIEAATRQIIAFTDSDCIPDPRWIEMGVQELQSGAERVAGRIELFSEREPPSLADEYERLIGFDQQSYAAKGTAATANMTTWKHSFDVVGRFDGALLSGGDMDWGFRAQRHGIGIRYAPECVVRHPTRGSLGALFKKARRVSSGASAVRELGGGRMWLFRGLLPPKSTLTIARASHLALVRRVRLMGVAYALKLWHTWSLVLLRIGVQSPVRR